MKRLWDKGEALNELMHDLTVGDDPESDRNLVIYDAVGSAAHAKMLAKVGLLSDADLNSLLSGLREVVTRGSSDSFTIDPILEDVHTAIEAFLSERCGEAGKRIHTARSRNDQVILAVRLFLRSKAHQTSLLLETLAQTIATRYDELEAIPMPGYTHLQPAMPSSAGMWLHSYFEGVLELLRDGEALRKSLDAQPLGGGAGFGTSFPIDREMVARLLGFSRVQRSPIDVNNSRGRYELRTIRWWEDVASLLEKFACDVMLFTTREFGFLSLPNDLTTGSSIMPQKRNPDLVELLRGRASRIRGAEAELQSVMAKLPSSYHRDLQYTKAPLFRAWNEIQRIISMGNLIFQSFALDTDRLRELMHPELYATYAANRLVQNGKAFRDAYREVGKQVTSGTLDISGLAEDFGPAQRATQLGMKSARGEFEALRRDRAIAAAKLYELEAAVLQ